MNKILCGDALTMLKSLPTESINTCITSPPYYGLRDYGCDGQIGLEETAEQYIVKLTEIFREVRRVIKNDSTAWINIGDSYAISASEKKSGIKAKDMLGIPWMLAFALRNDGWYLRSDIIWQKMNCLPESVKDRPTSSYEHLFLLSKSRRYYYDNEAIKEPAAPCSIERMKRGNSDKHKYTTESHGQKRHGINKPRKNRSNENFDIPTKRNKRNIWTTSTNSYKNAHFATYPVEFIKPCVLAGCPKGGVILDPFFGSGTTGIAALEEKRNYIGIELNPKYCTLAEERIKNYLLQ